MPRHDRSESWKDSTRYKQKIAKLAPKKGNLEKVEKEIRESKKRKPIEFLYHMEIHLEIDIYKRNP